MNISPLTIGIIGIIVLFVLLVMGMNIGICMMSIGFFGSWLVFIANGRTAAAALTSAYTVFKVIPFTQATNYTFVVIPLFVLMGQLCYYSGMSAGLYEMCEKLMGRLRGSLAMATVVACALFGAICGSSAATCATMGVVSLPEMRKHNYDDGLSCGAIAAGGTLGILIPPSTGFILFGIVSGESVGKLFAAGIIPGILLALCFCVAIAVVCWRHPEKAPDRMKFSAKEKLVSLKGGIVMVILFAIVIGGILTGFFTAVEASAVGVVIAFVYLCIRRQCSWKNIMACFRETVKTSGMIFLILIGAYVFGNFLTVSGLSTALADLVGGMNVSRYVILIVVLIIYALLGCLMDSLAMVMLTVPIFYPILVTTLGFNGIWYGVIMVMVMEMGLITPPVGMNVYIVSGVAKNVKLGKIFAGVVPMLIAMIIAIIIVILVPQLATWLPSMTVGTG